MPQTNIEWWAMMQGSHTMLGIPTYEVGELTEDGEYYHVTFSYSESDEFAAAKLIMAIIKQHPRKVTVEHDGEHIRIGYFYPAYMGDPHEKRPY
jgi:hypothetical protein